METQKYNGWTNFATWKINLELGLCDGDFVGYDEEMLKEFAEETILEQGNVKEGSIAEGIILNFLSDVNFQEIAKNANE